MNSWYFSKDGQQEGPVTAAQIVSLVNASVLDPAVTQVWREGLADWISLTQSPVFAEAPGMPRPANSTAAVNPYMVSSSTLANSRAARPDMPLEYPGIGRLAYVLFAMVSGIVLYGILFVTILAAFKTGRGAGLALGTLFIVLLFFATSLYLGAKRVSNLGMSGWAVLWSFVPFMNIWIHWRMLACPAGYENHRTLDTPGKVVTGLWIGVLVLSFIAPLFSR